MGVMGLVRSTLQILDQKHSPLFKQLQPGDDIRSVYCPLVEINPLHPKISMHILHTLLYTFP